MNKENPSGRGAILESRDGENKKKSKKVLTKVKKTSAHFMYRLNFVFCSWFLIVVNVNPSYKIISDDGDRDRSCLPENSAYRGLRFAQQARIHPGCHVLAFVPDL